MVQESTIYQTKYGVFTLSAMALIAGIILQCWGLARVYQVDPSVAHREGMASNSTLGNYLNCDTLAVSRPNSQAGSANSTESKGGGSNSTESKGGGNLDKMFKAQCKAYQAPYQYLWGLSAALGFFALIFTGWAIHKETRGPILLSGIWLGVTIALLFMSIMAFMHGIETTSTRLIHCDRLTPDEAVEVERQNLGRCIENSDAARHWHRSRRMLLSGIILNTIGLGILSFLLPWIFHLSKVRVLLPASAVVKDDPTSIRTIRAPSETQQSTPIQPQYTATAPGHSYV